MRLMDTRRLVEIRSGYIVLHSIYGGPSDGLLGVREHIVCCLSLARYVSVTTLRPEVRTHLPTLRNGHEYRNTRLYLSC